VYLQSLDLLGFKGFARPTKLTFEPGMVAIVGPNGCGKSNVLDAIRWVLGEQSAKTLRGSKMEDVIFHGTENLKPLGMAEVSITFADCEKVLGTDYNEVTVSRRVYRSGEGEYFINKTPCRLKDIQRLFMNTGIGTASYSMMEQGRIDQILSSRPEDRREIFEEASGITKFKSDRIEAMRKLEQTEANLLRLTDVIGEVKRQIGSLERQAGKARRYKVLIEEITRLDVFVTKQRLTASDEDINVLNSQIKSLADQLVAAHADIARLEEANAGLRAQMAETEHEIDVLMEARSAASSKLERAKDSMRLNSERIAESERQAREDMDEISRISILTGNQKRILDEHTAKLAALKKEQESADRIRQEKVEGLAKHEEATDNLRKRLEALQSEFFDAENTLSSLQNELISLEAGMRGDIVRRERLTVEKATIEKENASQVSSLSGIAEAAGLLDAEVATRISILDGLTGSIQQKEQNVATMQARATQLHSDLAAKKAQLEIMNGATARTEGFPAGARMILDKTNPLNLAEHTVLGPLVSQLDVDPEFRIPLETALRTWCDAVVVENTAAAVSIIASLEQGRHGSARLLAAGAIQLQHQPEGVSGTRLLDHVRSPEALRNLVERLLGNVFVVQSLAGIPDPHPAHCVFVTPGGALVAGSGAAEFWMAGSEQLNPLVHHRLLAETGDAIRDLETRLAAAQEEYEAARTAIDAVRSELPQAREQLEHVRQRRAEKEGERQVIARQAAAAREKLETVSWELDNLQKEDSTGVDRKQSITRQMSDLTDKRARLKAEIDAANRQVFVMDQDRTTLSSQAADARLRCSGLAQDLNFLANQISMTTTRISELEETAAARSRSLDGRQTHIENLKRAIAEANSQTASLEEELAGASVRLDAARQSRQKNEACMEESDRALAAKRAAGDGLRDHKAELDVRLAESTMRRQNMLDRVTSDYSVTMKDILESEEPVWENGRPEMEWMDARVTELRTKLDAMGPVNIQAIEEHHELEERHVFLTTQHDDLVNARLKLANMITQINRTTSEMFSQTFTAVNEQFDVMFKKLFNGGSARLVLVDEGDVLESGIEIIAKPPGKKMQSVSLLSGGERTLTAVSLLFAIYLVKPSPFCVLDELDAALDDSNIGRFVNVLQSFLDRSQFLVITHSQQTIASAGIIYGVTMEEKGVSKLISMKFVNGRPVPVKKVEMELPVQPEPSAKQEDPPAQPVPAAGPAPDSNTTT